MIVAFALVAVPLGMLLAALFATSFAVAIGWTFIVAAINLLPPPLPALLNALLGWPLFGSWLRVFLVLLLWIAVTFVFYWIGRANVTLPVAPAPPGLAATNATENMARGVLIGVATGANLVLLLLFLGWMPFGSTVALAVAAIGLMSSAPTLSNNPTMQVVIGWTALALPMVWPMTLLGWIFGALDTIGVVFGAPGVTPIPQWTRGNLILHGGWVQGCQRTLFNLGNFTVAHGDMNVVSPWADPGTPLWGGLCTAFGIPLAPAHVDTRTVLGEAFHESSHELSLAAFGWIFHLIGFADEYLPMPWSGGPALGANAYSELFAEGGLRTFGRNFLDQWLPAPPPPAPASNVPAIAAATVVAAPNVVVTAAAPLGVGPSIACVVNSGVTITSAAAVDPDGFPTVLGRFWLLLPGAPAGSVASPIGTTSGGPTDVAILFVPDVGGAYSLSLTVTDGVDGFPIAVSIEAVAAIISPLTSPPAAGTAMTLDATPSTGVTGFPLTFGWQVVAAPAGSAQLNLALTGATPVFTPDTPGDTGYTIELTVSVGVIAASGGPPIPLASTARISFIA